MIIFLIFILILIIYDIYYIVKNVKEKKKTLIAIYISMVILALTLGVYYYINEYGNSLGYYVLKFLNINY